METISSKSDILYISERVQVSLPFLRVEVDVKKPKQLTHKIIRGTTSFQCLTIKAQSMCSFSTTENSIIIINKSLVFYYSLHCLMSSR